MYKCNKKFNFFNFNKSH